MNFKNKLIESIRSAVHKAQKQGALPQIAVPDILVERPQNLKYGDYASSLPLRISRSVAKPPMEIASTIKRFIEILPEVEQINISPPGFINFILNDDWVKSQVDEIIKIGQGWGNIDIGKAERVQIEFVSVNPTGPLHVGHGRGAVIGSTLANILKSAGYIISTEYYINDAGSQLDAFKRTLFARYQQCLGNNVPIPEDGYLGDYMIDIAKSILESESNNLTNLSDERLQIKLGELGLEIVMKNIKEDLELLRVKFDVWFSEKSLNESGLYEKVMNLLRERNCLTERENAIWFTSSLLGEDKDNVLVRSDGSPTYFAYDIVYHFNKFIVRKFDKVIDIWGADHQGHISRMKAAVNAIGINPERLIIMICQLVTLKRGSEIVRVSKRSGDIITLREVIDEVGTDACRFVFLSRSIDSQMDFDIELAKKQSSDNPVYYVQYAHARICSILRLADEKNIDFSQGNVLLLSNEEEIDLIKKLLLLPEIIEIAATNLEPHHLPYYALDLATLFHRFYKKYRVISSNREKTMARLKLVKAVQIVLEKTLNLMGMTAPESM